MRKKFVTQKKSFKQIVTYISHLHFNSKYAKIGEVYLWKISQKTFDMPKILQCNVATPFSTKSHTLPVTRSSVGTIQKPVRDIAPSYQKIVDPLLTISPTKPLDQNPKER